LPNFRENTANLKKVARRDEASSAAGATIVVSAAGEMRGARPQEDVMTARPARYRYSREFLADARRRYEETDEPLKSIAAGMGMLPYSLYRRAVREGWTLRKDRPPRDLPPARKIQIEADAAIAAEVGTRECAPTGGSSPLAVLVDRLAQVIETELRTVEIMRATLGAEPQPVAEAERTAHTLATLSGALSRLRRLRKVDALPDAPAGQGADETDLPDDLDQFRDALARRIELFVRSRAG
jgi:transposase-like protein